MSDIILNEKITTDQENADEVRKVYYDIKLRRDAEKDSFMNWILMTIFALILPATISSVISFFFMPKQDLLFMLFIPMLVITLICLTWFIGFTFIGGRFAKLSWDLFLDKRKGITIRWFKSNQVEISTGKVDERICFIPGDKLTEQTILEERLAGSANFMGRPVALLVQDNNFNVNLLNEFPSDPLNKDYNAAVQNSFDAGVFFNRVFEGNYLKLIMIVVCIVGLFSVIGLYFSWNASSQTNLLAGKILDVNNSLKGIMENQAIIKDYFNQAIPVMTNG